MRREGCSGSNEDKRKQVKRKKKKRETGRERQDVPRTRGEEERERKTEGGVRCHCQWQHLSNQHSDLGPADTHTRWQLIMLVFCTQSSRGQNVKVTQSFLYLENRLNRVTLEHNHHQTQKWFPNSSHLSTGKEKTIFGSNTHYLQVLLGRVFFISQKSSKCPACIC